MEVLDKEYNGAVKVVKVEHDANPQLIAEYKVRPVTASIAMRLWQLWHEHAAALCGTVCAGSRDSSESQMPWRACQIMILCLLCGNMS